MTVGRHLAAAVVAAVSDPGAWPLGMLGFMARGGLILLMTPILTLPTPVGLATMLGPQVISTGRLDGPLLRLVVIWSATLLGIVALALLASAVVQDRVDARRHPCGAEGRARVRGLVSVELLALVPIGVVLAVSLPTIVGEVRSELLSPGDLSVPFVTRLIIRTAIPLIAAVVAVIVCEALEGSLSRRILVTRRATRSAPRALGSVAMTAALAWAATLVVLLPGLVLIEVSWQATRSSWSRLGSVPPAAAPAAGAPTSATVSPDLVPALLSALGLVAIWVGVLLVCGIVSLVRAHLWTARASGTGDWTEVGD